MNDNLKPVITLPPFKRLCMTIGELPTSYLETMTYYEMLVWFTEYMKNTVIPTINNNGEAVSELQSLYIQLHDYVENYFENLDVQTEINNKLDQLVADGTLTNLLKQYIDPKFTEINAEITRFENSINGDITAMNLKIDAVTNGNPIPVSSVDDMTDTTKIYLLVTDGYWYYYDGDSWEQGGLYQSSVNMDDVNIQLQLVGYKTIANYYVNNQGVITEGSSPRFITDKIPVKEGTTVLVKAETNTSTISFCTFYDVNNQPMGVNYNAGPNTDYYSCVAPSNTAYMIISSRSDFTTDIYVADKTVMNDKIIENSKISKDNNSTINQLITDLTNGMTANLFNKNKALINYILSTTNGNANPSQSSAFVSDFIPVTVGSTLYIKAGSTGYMFKRIIGYDSNYKMVSGSTASDTSTYTIPEGVVYVRFQQALTYLDSIIVSTSLQNYVRYGYINKVDNTIYVAKTGVDTNKGTKDSPVLTINKALEFTPNTIIIDVGTYEERLQLSNDINIIGNGEVIITSNQNNVILANNINININNINVTGANQDGFRLNNCKGTLTNCTATECGSNGFRLDGSNMILNNCTANGNNNDGFNAHDTVTNSSYGVFNNCYADSNGDDGLSFHEYGTIIVNGGVYSNNTAGGITPFGSCKAKIYNAIVKDNMAGIYGFNTTEEPSGEIYSFNCLIQSNTKGILQANNYTIISVGDIFANNTTMVQGTVIIY